jgi:phospholipase D-like protein
LEPSTGRGSGVALKAIYEAVGHDQQPSDAWRRCAARLMLACGPDGSVARTDVDAALGGIRQGLSVGPLLTAARQLNVLEGDGPRLAFYPLAAEEVARALDLVGDALAGGAPPIFWIPVGTVPEALRRRVVVPNLRQTAGVLLDIIDRAGRTIWLTAPFIERAGMEFLTEALLGALERGVRVSLVSRTGTLQSGAVASLIQGAAHRDTSRRFAIYEVSTEVSDLGSHAKVCVADDSVCYLGSANLTAHGFGRHLELGARLHGPEVATIRAAVEAIADLGTRVYPPT